jgi:RNA polymerase sigma-70 factor (ECF subfamily)
MKTIAVRKAIKKSKKKIHFDPHEKADQEVGEELNVWFDAELLDQAIRNLPAGSRAVFMLIAVEGYSHQECAKMLGISESTSKSQLNYAKGLLKKRLKTLLQA